MASSPIHQRPLRHSPDHPPYAAMISEAIRSLAEAGGSMPVDISDKIKSIYNDLPISHDKLFPYYLNKLTAMGDFVAGADGRFSLPGNNFIKTEVDISGVSAAAISELVDSRRSTKKRIFTQREAIDEENAKPTTSILKPDVVSVKALPNNKEKVSLHVTEEQNTRLPEASCLDSIVLALPVFCRPNLFVSLGNTAEKQETEVETMVKGKLPKLQFRRRKRNQGVIENEPCSSIVDDILEANLPAQDKLQKEIDNEQFLAPTFLGSVGQSGGNIDCLAQSMQMEDLIDVMGKNNHTESGNKQNLVSSSAATFVPLPEGEESAADIAKSESDVCCIDGPLPQPKPMEVELLQTLQVPSASGDKSDASLVMPKRRGRPAKRNAPSNDYLVLKEEGQTETEEGDKSIIDKVNSLPPKSCGRPRKMKSNQIFCSDSVVHSPNHELKSVSDPAGAVMPKRRGRPRKIKSDQRFSSESGVHSSSHEIKSVSDPAAMAMPEYGGRSPKNCKADIATGPTPISGALPPKRRGRPPKNKGL